MKKTFLLLCLAAGMTAQGQFNFGLSAGTSTNGAAVGLLNIGTRINNINAEYDQRFYINAKDAAFFGLRSGPVITAGNAEVLPMAGIYYKFASAENKQLNGWRPGIGGRMLFKNISADVFYIDKAVMFSVGFFGWIE